MAADDEAAVLEALAHVPRGDRLVLEAARVEAGQPRFGIDLTEENIPLEAGLANRAIHFSKGCYIGQEVICRVDSMGTPARRLVQLHAEKTADVPAFGQELVVGSKTVGTVTSAVRSETLDGVVALGYVKKRFNAQGTVLQAGPEGAEFTILGTVGDQENQLS